VPTIVLLSVPVWILLGAMVWPRDLAEAYDRTVLPVALRVVYGQPVILWLCAAGCIAALLLWPHRWAWPLVAACAGAVFLGWVIWYEMWRNAVLSTVLVGAAAAYALARYLWVPIVRGTRLPGWRMYRSLRRYVERQSRCDLYYDAIRAFCRPASGDSDSPAARLWRRGGAVQSRGTGIWGRLFAVPARWYRAGWTSAGRRARAQPCAVQMELARLIARRQVPASLEIQWLWQALERLWRRRTGEVTRSAGDPERWTAAYDALVEVTEARAEYLAFDPPSLPPSAPALAQAAEMYDDLCRIALTRQLWILNTQCPDPALGAVPEDLQGQWEKLDDQRRRLGGNAVILRQRFCGVTAPDRLTEKMQAVLAPAAGDADSPRRRAQKVILAISYCQQALAETDERALPASGLVARLTGAIHRLWRDPQAADRRAVAQKAVELSADSGDYRWAQDVLSIPWPEWPEGELLAGHVYWRLARTTHDDRLQADASRQAALAFLRGRWGDELEALKAEVRDRAAETAEAGAR